MTLDTPPTMESFYKFCGQRKLMGLRCNRCRELTAPPRSLCSHCGSPNVAWVELPYEGRLVTYTVIHIAPTQFQAYAPYAIGIVELPGGVRLPGMIRNTQLENPRIGMALAVDFETSTPAQWPQWPRYFFRQP